MATFPVPNGVFGDVYTEAMHQARGDGVNGVHVGEMAIVGQAAGDLITAASATQLGHVAAPAAAGQLLVSGGAGLPPAYSSLFTTGTVARRTVAETITAAWSFNAGFNVAVGSQAAPSIRFAGDPNTGMWQSTADRVDFATGGVNRLALHNDGATFGNNLTLTLPGGHLIAADAGINPGAADTPSLFFNGDTDTGIYRWGVDRIGFTAGGSVRVTLGTTDTTFAVPILAGGGSAAEPGYAFNGNTNTGLWRPAADQVAITTGGATRFVVASTGTQVQSGNFTVSSGLVSLGTPPIASGTTLAWTSDGPNFGQQVVRTSSSARYKQDLAPAQLNPAPLFALQPQRFAYRNTPDRRELGFVAEDVAALLPEAVHCDAEGRPESIDQGAFNAYIVAALKALETRLGQPSE